MNGPLINLQLIFTSSVWSDNNTINWLIKSKFCEEFFLASGSISKKFFHHFLLLKEGLYVSVLEWIKLISTYKLD